LENASGRIHVIHNGTKGIFVFGNRYAPDYSGVLSSSPLHIRELSAFTDIPVFNSANPDHQMLNRLLVPAKSRPGRKKAA
jgi:hypothetical protein